MQYCKPEYIAELQKDQELKFWRIYDSSGKTEMNNQLQDISLSNSIELLQKDLENTSGDYVIVKLYEKKPERNSAGIAATTGISRKVSLQGGISKAPAAYGGPSAGLDLILGLVEEKNKLNLEILKLTLEQNQKESSWKEQAINLIREKPEILSMLPSLLSGIFGNKNVNTASTPIAAPATAAAQERLKSTLDRFAALDPEYISTLEKMAAKCEQDPSILPVLKAGL